MHAEFCEICGCRRGEYATYFYLDGKEVCEACSYKSSEEEARKRDKRQVEYQKVLAIARANEKRAKGE